LFAVDSVSEFSRFFLKAGNAIKLEDLMFENLKFEDLRGCIQKTESITK